MLRSALTLAQLGEVNDVVLYFRDTLGAEDMALTGLYRERPAEALRAAMRMSMKLTQFESQVRGHP